MLQLTNNPAHLASLQAILVAIGVTGTETRTDAAGDTLFLARELEQVSATSYDVLIDPIIGRQLVPFNTSVDEGAETYSYDMYDGFALAEWITNYASAVGQAEVFKTRFSATMRDIGSHYQYTYQDLQKAAFARKPVDRMRALKARQAHEQKIDDVIAVGDTARGIQGLTNSSNIPTVAPAVGTWDSATSGADLMKDLDKLTAAIEQASAGNFVADTAVLPLSVKPLLQQPFSTTDARSVEKVWLGNQPANGVKAIKYWKRLNTASAIGGPRAIAFKGGNQILEFLLAYDYRELPPQQVNYTTKVLTIGRLGGLTIHYALATAKMDLDASP
jgi:hypothetical protein